MIALLEWHQDEWTKRRHEYIGFAASLHAFQKHKKIRRAAPDPILLIERRPGIICTCAGRQSD